MSWRDQREDELPADADEVNESVVRFNILNLARLFVFVGMEHASVDKLI